MSDPTKLKVFISWSGPLSQAIAGELRQWLPNLFDSIDPFMSENDIRPGQRGLSQIETQLAGTSFGIIVVTPDNQNAPWLNFEAGALSKVISEPTASRVVPLLVDINSPTDIKGPLAQFQARLLDRPGIEDLVVAIADAVGVDRQTARARCDAFWQQFERGLESARQGMAAVPAPRRSSEDLLEEILTIVRSMSANVTPSFQPEMINDAIEFEARQRGIEAERFSQESGGVTVFVAGATHPANLRGLREALESSLRIPVRVVADRSLREIWNDVKPPNDTDRS